MRANTPNIVLLIALIGAISVSGFPSALNNVASDADHGHSLKQRRSVLDNAGDLLGQVTDKAGNIVNKLKEELEDLTSQVTGTVGNVLSTRRRRGAAKIESSLLGTVNDVAGDALSGVDDVVNEVKGTLGGVVNKVGDVVDGVLSKRKRRSSAENPSLLDTVNGALGGIESGAGEVVNTLQGTLGNVGNKVGDVVDGVLSKRKRSSGENPSLLDTVNGALGGIKSGVGEVVNTLESTLGNVVNEVGDVVGGVLSKRKRRSSAEDSTLLDTVNGALRGIKSGAGEVVNTLEGTLGNVGNKVDGLVGGVLSNRKRRSSAENPSLLDTVNGALGGIKSGAGEVVNTLKGTLGNVVNQVEDVVDGVLSERKRRSAAKKDSSLVNTLNGVVGGTLSDVNDVANEAKDTVGVVIGETETIVDDALAKRRRRSPAADADMLATVTEEVENLLEDADNTPTHARLRRESAARKSRQTAPEPATNVTRKARSADAAQEPSDANPHHRHIDGRVRNETLRAAATTATETDSPAASNRRRRTIDFQAQFDAFSQQLQAFASELEVSITNLINEIVPGSSTATSATGTAARSSPFTGNAAATSSASRAKRQAEGDAKIDPKHGSRQGSSTTVEGSARLRRSVDGVEKEIQSLLTSATNSSADDFKAKLETFITDTIGKMTGEEAIATIVKVYYEVMSLPLEDIVQLVIKATAIASEELGMDVSKMLNDSLQEVVREVTKNGL